MLIRRLTPDDAAAYSALRREMLADAPWAFASSPEDDKGIDPEFIAASLAQPHDAIVGAFDSACCLIGAAGVYRDRHIKMSHRAHIWGVYVTPSARRHGTCARILTHLFEVAKSWQGVNSVGLSVNERSVGARRVYERLGFKAWGTEPGALLLDGEFLAETHMVLMLDQPSPSRK